MKDDRLYLVHIVECLRKIQSYTVDGEEFFRKDGRTQDAAHLPSLARQIESLLRPLEASANE